MERLQLRPGIQRHFSCVKFDRLMKRLSGFPSLLFRSDEISSSNHFSFSLAPLASPTRRFAERRPDSLRFSAAAEVLGRRPCLLNSSHFALSHLHRSFSLPTRLPCAALSFSSPALALVLFLFSFFFIPLPPSHGADSSAGCCSRGCCASLCVHSFC